MRHFLTLIATALTVSFAPAALAAPGHGSHGSSAYSAPVPSASSGRHGPSVYRPDPIVQRLTPAQLRAALRLQAKFEAQRVVLLRQLRAAERKVERLEARPMVRPAVLRQAKLDVLRVEKTLAKLELRYHRQLANLLTPIQLRVFMSLS